MARSCARRQDRFPVREQFAEDEIEAVNEQPINPQITTQRITIIGRERDEVRMGVSWSLGFYWGFGRLKDVGGCLQVTVVINGIDGEGSAEVVGDQEEMPQIGRASCRERV